jgi:hypothetical protein
VWRVLQLWSLLNFLLPDIFDDWESFSSWFDFTEGLTGSSRRTSSSNHQQHEDDENVDQDDEHELCAGDGAALACDDSAHVLSDLDVASVELLQNEQKNQIVTKLHSV